ncbi:MAG: cell division protein SepF [Clostridia bacterium]|nr:cell division protein SepF [Clostridia bacterium]
MFGAIKKKLIDFGLLEEEEELEEEVEKIFKQKEASQKEPKETLQAPKKGKIVNIHTTTQLKVVVVQPMAFEDSKEIADHLKTKKPIVVNLENIDREVAKRIIDFLSGAVYSLDGNIQKISNGIFLIVPYNMGIMGDFKDELRNKVVFPF